jgi:protein-L-isoaspartate(D-aspartate) O-methyltransferase
VSSASGTREAALTAQIQRTVADTAAQTGRAALSPRVLAALGTVRRDRFLPEDQRSLACLDLPLPIGYGQTISQPFIVAIMTDLLDLEPTDTVLEIGTGSGYQAAVLAQLARQVYSIEVVPALATRARAALRREGLRNVVVRAGDGAEGWPGLAPFDAIIVTAATPEISPRLLQQLKPGGRLVAPIGRIDDGQRLTVFAKDADGVVTRQPVLDVRFVPLIDTGSPGDLVQAR